jgi:mRNA degradation ribonuclease J1/J2
VTFLDKTRVTPIRVDHSIPGACGFLVETSDGKQVALTGDFRMHGPVDLAFEREAMVVIGVSGNNIERIFVSPSKV